MNHITLLIGGAAGIDRALAMEFARHGHDIVIVSRDDDNVHGMAMEVAERYMVDACGIVMDLHENGACEELLALLSRRALTVDVLVNIVGMGERGLYQMTPWEVLANNERLESEPLARLVHLLLPGFLDRKRGRILNVGFSADLDTASYAVGISGSKAYIVPAEKAGSLDPERSGVTVTEWTEGPTLEDLQSELDPSLSAVSRCNGLREGLRRVARLAYIAAMRGERDIGAGPWTQGDPQPSSIGSPNFSGETAGRSDAGHAFSGWRDAAS